MDGLWEADRLDEFFSGCCVAASTRRSTAEPVASARRLLAMAAPIPSRGRAFQVGERHYTIGTSLSGHARSTMTYSSAIGDADHLARRPAAETRTDLSQTDLRPGERLLDIRLRLGRLAHPRPPTMASRSSGSLSPAATRIRPAAVARAADPPRVHGLPRSGGPVRQGGLIGMVRACRSDQLPIYFEIVHRCWPTGSVPVHTIGDYTTARRTDPWIEKYILSQHKLPSARQLTRRWTAVRDRDWHNFGRITTAP